LRVARAFALASTFVVSLSFPSALQAFHTFRALERNIDLKHRLASALAFAFAFSVRNGKLNLLYSWFIDVCK
jgi:hypothetical protein